MQTCADSNKTFYKFQLSKRLPIADMQKIESE